MDSPTEPLDLPPPAYELSQKEFDDKLAEAANRSLNLTPRPREMPQPPPAPPAEPQPGQQQAPELPTPLSAQPTVAEQLPSVQVTPPPSSGPAAQEFEVFEEWDEEIFRANELRLRALAESTDRSSTPTQATTSPPSDSTPAASSSPGSGGKERASWLSDTDLKLNLSPPLPSAPGSGSGTGSQGSGSPRSPRSPPPPSPSGSTSTSSSTWGQEGADNRVRRAPSGARAPPRPGGGRLRALPSIPQGRATGPSSPVSERGGMDYPADKPGSDTGESNGVGNGSGNGNGNGKSPERDLPSMDVKHPLPEPTRQASPKVEKERPSWYYEAGLGDSSSAGGSTSTTTTVPIAPITVMRADTTPSLALPSHTPPPAEQPRQWPSSASTSPAGSTVPQLRDLPEEEEEEYDENSEPLPAFTPIAPPLPGPDYPSDPPPPAVFSPIASPTSPIAGGRIRGSGGGGGMRPPPRIGAYVSDPQLGHARQESLSASTPQSAPSAQREFDPAETRHPSRNSMPPLSHAASSPAPPTTTSYRTQPTAVPERTSIQSTGQRQGLPPMGYSQRLQFDPRVAYGAETGGQAGTVGAVGGAVGLESKFGDVRQLYNASVTPFLPNAKPSPPQFPTAAQAYAASYSSHRSSSSTSPNSASDPYRPTGSSTSPLSPNSLPTQSPTTPAPTYRSDPSSPLPSPPAAVPPAHNRTGSGSTVLTASGSGLGLSSITLGAGAGGRPYDTALAESVAPIAESVKQAHQQQQQQQQNPNTWSTAPSLLTNGPGLPGGGAPVPAPAPSGYVRPAPAFNPLNAYNAPPPPAAQGQQAYRPVPAAQAGYAGIPGGQSLYPIPVAPGGYGQPAPPVPPLPAGMQQGPYGGSGPPQGGYQPALYPLQAQQGQQWPPSAQPGQQGQAGQPPSNWQGQQQPTPPPQQQQGQKKGRLFRRG